MNERLSGAISKALEASWSATSKLESQAERNPDLPSSYATIVEESFAALRELQAALDADAEEAAKRLSAEQEARRDFFEGLPGVTYRTY